MLKIGCRKQRSDVPEVASLNEFAIGNYHTPVYGSGRRSTLGGGKRLV